MKKSGVKIRKKVIFGGLIILILVFGVFIVLDATSDKKTMKTVEFSEVKRICELATLECYYHNVAEKVNELDHWWNKLWKEKKYFFEYEGMIKMGIDFDQVEISQPDENGVVSVYVPPAKVFEGDYVNVRTMGNLISEKGIGVKITTQEQAKLIGEAQKNMKQNAKADKDLLNQAYENAKDLIEQYIITVGDQLGQQFTVEWVDKSEK